MLYYITFHQTVLYYTILYDIILYHGKVTYCHLLDAASSRNLLAPVRLPPRQGPGRHIKEFFVLERHNIKEFFCETDIA